MMKSCKVKKPPEGGEGVREVWKAIEIWKKYSSNKWSC